MKNTKNNGILFAGILLILLVGLTACTSQPNEYKGTNTQVSNFDGLNASQDLKKFNNIGELKDFITENQNANNGVNIRTISSDFSKGGVAGAPMATGTSESADSAPSKDGGSVDYSHTNVQVENVDEADFVKNDDKYIYMIVDGKLVIIDSSKNDIISQTDLGLKSETYYGPQARDLYLKDNKVIVFVDSYEKSLYFDQYNIRPYETYIQGTRALLYDVSNRENPKLLETYDVSGYYYNSRLIGNDVYIITQDSLYDIRYYDGPMVKYSGTSVKSSIYYFDNPEENYQMNTVTSIDIDTEKVVDSESYMLGYGSTLMVSEDNIYIAYQKQNYWCWGWRCSGGNTDARERFVTVVVPLLEGSLKNKVENILDKKLSQEDEWKQISAEFETFYVGLKDDEALQDKYEDMFSNIQDALNEYDEKKSIEDSKTIIHKIAIKDGDIEYKSKGEVDGRLLNQFSMDESDGNLRVATSINYWLNSGSVQYNNVYVLNDNMDIIGSLENIAKNESIYSTRFVGDKLYLVTFRQVDPFFVIDLSNAEKPEILGYLKIPGYSSYLHPISDKLMLGVGQELKDNEWGGQSQAGVKVSLFDVSDFKNPKEVDSYIIGLEGTYTPVSNDHRAFLYIDSKGLVVLPVMEVSERVKIGDKNSYTYRTSRWNGAYVLHVDNEGIELEGKIEHSKSSNDFYDSWYGTANVIRSLYINDNLYTISTRSIKVSDLNNLEEKPDTIKLPYTEPVIYGYDGKPMPVDNVATSSGSAGSAVATVAPPVAME